MDSRSGTNKWNVKGEVFNLPKRFDLVEHLGSGTYGVVCAAHDKELDCNIAIKKCKDIFSSKILAKRTVREVRLLRLVDHENIIKVKTILEPTNIAFTDIYVVFEVMDTDLAEIIKSGHILSGQHLKYFTFQLLQALKYMHAAHIVHRDLKPRNLLINKDCTLKVADFGLARIYNDDNSSTIAAMTEYVTTRWYRAPEVLVGWGKYGSAVDMWSTGCILAELINREPILPGKECWHQLSLICQLLGKPLHSFIEGAQKPSYRLGLGLRLGLLSLFLFLLLLLLLFLTITLTVTQTLNMTL
jgi:serine/threonine protein kinase